MMMIDDNRGEGVKNAEKLMTSYVNDPLLVVSGTFERLQKFGCIHRGYDVETGSQD
jgi:hypothetical protein